MCLIFFLFYWPWSTCIKGKLYLFYIHLFDTKIFNACNGNVCHCFYFYSLTYKPNMSFISKENEWNESVYSICLFSHLKRIDHQHTNEPPRGKTNNLQPQSVTAKLISAFVFATRIVQFLFYLNPKLQASSSFLRLYSPVCVGPGRKPRRPVFSRRGSFDEGLET